MILTPRTKHGVASPKTGSPPTCWRVMRTRRPKDNPASGPTKTGSALENGFHPAKHGLLGRQKRRQGSMMRRAKNPSINPERLASFGALVLTLAIHGATVSISLPWPTVARATGKIRRGRFHQTMVENTDQSRPATTTSPAPSARP